MTILAKLAFILIVLLGEALQIAAEVLAARNCTSQKTMLACMGWVTLGGLVLIIGYMLGMRLFKDIWVVSVVSITCVLISEPIIVYAVFRELPSTGSLLGFVFGAIGFACTLCIK